MTMPKQIWIDWKQANDACVAFDEPPSNEGDGCRDEFVSAHEVQAMIDAAVKAERERCDEYARALEQELRDRANPPKMSESDFDCLILDAIAEATKAMRKFPQPNYVISKVAEEAGEVVKAAIHCAEGRETAENVRGEMKQLIAMLFRLWVEGDQVHGLPSIAAAIRSQP